MEIDCIPELIQNVSMSTETVIPAEIIARMQQAAEKAAKGIRDPEEMRNACAAMDRMREELRRRVGIVDLAVELVRDVRDA